MTATILTGDCRLILPTLPENMADAIVCDPPYELGFMGKAWDRSGVAFDTATWAAALRVAKPGAFLLAFGGSRTYHRVACAIEDAGWEIRDTIMWIYGSGFPKSRNGEWGGTGLKPAHEPIIVARKPLIGTVSANHAAFGTGGLNIDSCRVDSGDSNPSIGRRQGATNHLRQRSASDSEAVGRIESRTTPERYREARPGEELGRWPANVIHDGSDEVLAAFPDAPGQQGDLQGHSRERLSLGIYGDMPAARNATARNDSGSSARFFYCAKATKKDREAGLDSFDAGRFSKGGNVEWDNPYLRGSTDRKNTHPTVKPTDLMRYLCRLVTPAGGTVLDPFTGSGSTGRGAVLEGFRFVGVELCDGTNDTPNYAAIAVARIADAEREFEAEAAAVVEAARQTDLFKEQAA